MTVIVAVAACSAPAGQPSNGTGGVPDASASPTPTASLGATPVVTSPSTPSPAVTVAPEETPKSTASYWAQDPPKPLLMGAAVRVVVNELNIREGASTSAKRLDTLAIDAVILVASLTPPVNADGYTWYYGTGPFGDGHGALPPLPHDPQAGNDPATGWFAATKGSTAYVEKLEPRCPSASDLLDLTVMLPAERLGCFGGRTIDFEGSYRSGCPVCEHFGSFEPAWLANPNELDYVLTERHSGQERRSLRMRFPPDVGRPERGSIVLVSGHFDDPASVDCSIAIVPWDYRDMHFDAVAASVARLWCRQMFVVERYQVIGIDESYDPEHPFD